jgi:hypothetical protein
VRFKADRDRHLYTPLDDAAIGPVSKSTVRLAPGEVALFVTLPYEVTRIELDVPESVDAGSRLRIGGTVKTRGGLAGVHVLQVSVIDPSGKLPAAYERTIVGSNGHGETYIPLAYNEAPGRYRIVIRDVLTGMAVSTVVNVI